MKKLLKFFGSALLALGSIGAYAADVTYDFDGVTDPIPGYGITVLQIGGDTHAVWGPYDGNPATGGFLDITDAANSQGTMIIFPVLDVVGTESQPLKGFKLTADVRIGNGTIPPADGFSISFARESDPILYWANQTPPVLRGTAGGDSIAAAEVSATTPDLCASGNLECGTKTGVAIAFDAWNGNWWPRNGVYPTGDDVIGVNVRVDDQNTYVAASTINDGACNDINSLQTGPRDGTGTTAPLCWAPLSVELTNTPSGPVVSVSYKNSVLISNQAVSVSLPLYGRLILMGRTGGANEIHHVDNIHLITYPSSEASVQGVSGSFDSFSVQIRDLGVSIVTNVSQVLLDTTNNVTAQCTVTKSGPITTVTYTNPTWFASLSGHRVDVTFETSVPQTLTGYGTFTVPLWAEAPAALALPLACVSNPGFAWKSYQTYETQPNTIRFTEELILGTKGSNFATPNSGTYNGPVNFGNGDAGEFGPTRPTPIPEVAWTTVGIGANATYFPHFNSPGSAGGYDAFAQCALELYTHVYFPTSGVYTMYVGTDDGYALSLGAYSNAKDRMGYEFMSYKTAGGRGIGTPGDRIYLKVDQPGAYAGRLLFENGTGGCDLEWYFTFDSGATFVPLGDPACPVVPYQTACQAGPYVKSANPVRDSQNAVFYQPIVVDLGDGTGTMTVDPTSVNVAVDGTLQTITAIKTGDTTHVVQTGTVNWPPGNHTIVLTFRDNAATPNSYSYSWNFRVWNLSTYAVRMLPATNRLDSSAIDKTKPGFLIRTWQSTGQPNNMWWTEEQLIGLHGANDASMPDMFLNPVGYPYGAFDWGNAERTAAGQLGNGLPDFTSSYFTASGAYSSAEFLWNNDMALVGISAFTGNYDNSAMDIACWLDFPAAGTYVMCVTSDDGFKLSSPYANPLNRADEFPIYRVDAGRGIGAPVGDNTTLPRGNYDYILVGIPAAGAYPFRLVWENGGGGAGVEWNIYQFLPNGGVGQTLVNDPNGTVKAYRVANVVAPFISGAYPIQDSTVTADTTITIGLMDGGAAVVDSSIVLKVNGVTQSATASRVGNLITITAVAPAEGWALGRTTVELTFSDGTTTRTYTYSFNSTVVTLTGGFPLGSEDTTKPGFEWHIWQSANAIGPDDISDEILLSGSWTPNIATLGPNGNAYTIPGYINWSSDLSAQGNFTSANGYPDVAVPGIPGTTASADQYAGEFLTYISIPTAGLFRLGVNSDDGFKLTPTHARPLNVSALWVETPGALAGPKYATPADPATAPAPPAPIYGKLVVTDPLIAHTPLVNAAAVAGNIAVCRRGTINFSTKIANCYAAGAIAVIVCNNQAGDVTMGATTPPGYQPVPAVSIRQVEGDALIAAAQAGTIYGTLTARGRTQGPATGAIFDGGRGASDTVFLVRAPAPGVYPVRLFFYEGGGGDNIEFYSQDSAGVRTLVNDSVPAAYKTYRALQAAVQPTVSITGPDAAGNVTITWTGTLESANSLGDVFRGVFGVTSPLTIPANQAAKYYRASVYNGY